MGRGGW